MSQQPVPQSIAAAGHASEPDAARLVDIAAAGLASLGLRDPSIDLLSPIAEVIAQLAPRGAEADKGVAEDAR